MEIVESPSIRWLESAAATCAKRVDISSPFVGQSLVTFLAALPRVVTKTLLTRTRLVDFASGASDLSAVIAAAEAGATVLGLDRLHAKVYVFDETTALVTSANATYSGWHRNAECGVGIRDTDASKNLSAKIRTGFGASPAPSSWTTAQLLSFVPAVERLKSRIPSRTRIRVVEGEEPTDFVLSKSDAEELLSSAASWTQLVFHGVLQIGAVEFSTQDVVDACSAEIATRFPSNRHPREKIRQQLQALRDLGLITFLGNGRYRLSNMLQG